MRKLNVLICFPAYGGNGGISSEVPDVRKWMCNVLMDTQDDERIGWVETYTVGDTPITMVRNRFVKEARKRGADVLVMVDSDQGPDYHLGRDPSAKPFFTTSFDFLYENYDKGPHVIGAPYGGPPEVHENVYVFLWRSNRNVDFTISLEQYKREEAAMMAGIQECAALPTGLIMYDIRAFDLIDPPYFWYEFSDKEETEKASTEDVTNTRDISLAGQIKLGYNPIHCNWDAWAAHYKPWPVSKPTPVSAHHVAQRFKAAIESGREPGERDVQLTEPAWVKQMKKLGDMINGVDVHELDPPEPDEDEAPPEKMTNAELSTRNLYGYEVENYGHVTPKHELNKLRFWLQLLIDEKNFTDCDDRVRVLEIGSWTGDSAIAMASLDPRVSVKCVDPWTGNQGDWTHYLIQEENIYDIFVENVSQPELDISWFTGTSEEYRRECPYNTGFDYIFIDGEHDYQNTRDDIIRWLPFLRTGGTIVMHDYCDQFPGVVEAVNEIFAECKSMIFQFEKGGMIGFRQQDIKHLKYTELVS